MLLFAEQTTMEVLRDIVILLVPVFLAAIGAYLEYIRRTQNTIATKQNAIADEQAIQKIDLLKNTEVTARTEKNTDGLMTKFTDLANAKGKAEGQAETLQEHKDERDAKELVQAAVDIAVDTLQREEREVQKVEVINTKEEPVPTVDHSSSPKQKETKREKNG